MLPKTILSTSYLFQSEVTRFIIIEWFIIIINVNSKVLATYSTSLDTFSKSLDIKIWHYAGVLVYNRIFNTSTRQ